MKKRTTIVGVFSDVDDVLRAERLTRDRGLKIEEFYSPYRVEQIEELSGGGESPIRYFTLLGGVLGCAGGFALTIGLALRHGIITGDKPIIAIPSFFIIAFELTILVSALATIAVFLWKIKPRANYAGNPYHTGFTEGDFGVAIRCAEKEVEEAKKMLIDAGALEVKIE